MNRKTRRSEMRTILREFKEIAPRGWVPLEEIELNADLLGRAPQIGLGIRSAWKSPLYIVQTFAHETLDPGWGIVEHAIVRRVDGAPVRSWYDLQRIKDEVFGAERTAIEVFPARSRLVDDAHLYHLWLLPPNLSLPFGLK